MESLIALQEQLDGELYFDHLMQVIYATDASVYRELPLAVALPKTKQDIKRLIQFAHEHQTSLIPRAAGTSLAGQCVGSGIVVDVSKFFNQILEFNKEERWVRVQPGVVRDALNAFLKPHGLFFSPITSTANRATIGGMVGNNSCGTTSIIYGSTREHVLALETILSDGSEVCFQELDEGAFLKKTQQNDLEGQLYRHIQQALNDATHRQNIQQQFPKATIHRRNTGYALDYLLETALFSDSDTPFNFCKLLCGSEGTLAFTTEIKLHLDPLPPPYDVVVAAHFHDIHESLRATQLAMQQQPTACELMDHIILNCTKENIEQRKNRWFVEGDPAAILMVEFRGNSLKAAEQQAQQLIQQLQQANMGYAFPIIPPSHTQRVWALRKAGLGLLANLPGDKKAVACIEDTSVALEDLADYIADFEKIMEGFGQQSVIYAHAGAGELHLRPILDLKQSSDVAQFYQISKASAALVKQYQGSLSGEHGDGRLRAPFLPMMVGEANYQLFQDLKHQWDPQRIFNPNKIVDAPPMNSALRYAPDVPTKELTTLLDFSATGGILRAAEKCNGSGDCRKLPLSGGTMCPSYQATRHEKDTTRARANTLREFLTQSQKKNPFNHKEIKEVLDLCLSCKGCTSECPSNVDMAGLKAEFLHQYYQSNRLPLRARAFAYVNAFNQLGGIFPKLYNFFLTNSFFSLLAKKALGIAPQRSMPTIHPYSLRAWYRKHYQAPSQQVGAVYLFCDEFTNWNDTAIGIKGIQLLVALGYAVELVEHGESGRAAISKGLLPRAQRLANQNVAIFQGLVSEETPLLGIEPSAVLSFRDEYPRLVDTDLVDAARQLAPHCLMLDEFLYREVQEGRITPAAFTNAPKQILLHGHCHQKALGDLQACIWALSLPENYTVELIPSGCCGMAGSFGYEKEHFDLSQQVGDLVLFPAVNEAAEAVVIAAPGTSCRHQILDGTGRRALHPVEILYEAVLR